MTEWITKKLGTMAHNEDSEPGVFVMDVRDLNDESNDPMRIVPKIIMGDYIIREGNRLAIRCMLGHNRSNTIAAAIIAYQLNISLNEALYFVQSKVPRANPHDKLVASTNAALEFLKKNLGYSN